MAVWRVRGAWLAALQGLAPWGHRIGSNKEKGFAGVSMRLAQGVRNHMGGYTTD